MDEKIVKDSQGLAKDLVNDCISRQAAIDALDEIRHALWEIDIPSPTVPEYIEHHEQIQSVWKLLDKKQKELYAMPSAQPERKRGKWEIYVISMFDGEGCRCSECGFEGVPYWDYCPNCGAKMEVDDGSD